MSLKAALNYLGINVHDIRNYYMDADTRESL